MVMYVPLRQFHTPVRPTSPTRSPSASALRARTSPDPPSVSSASSTRHENDASYADPWPSSPSSLAGDQLVAKTPTFEYYGFVVYMVSLAIFGTYLVWAYLPDHILYALGFTYYPDRYWAMALPAWLFMAVLSIYFFNMAYIMYATPLLNSPDTFYDPDSNVAPAEPPNDHLCCEVGGIPNIADIPISVVNKCLYS
ncbi:hypothetical protein EC988_000084 [Linderina pennispora]|nr:hypothetical protein EC988_000084 [Linderina pennispora]